jgi:pimeloyl-ACP methyl ester carboxylesterase
MRHETAVDDTTGRKYYLDQPDELSAGTTLVLSLHGGGSVGRWQHDYFPIHEHADSHDVVVITPSAATKEPFRRWDADPDDVHLQAVVDQVVDRIGAANLSSFWLAGHSQGSMTARRLLGTDWFADRVDGWLSLSGGRIGAVEMVPGFGPPWRGDRPRPEDGDGRPIRLGDPGLPEPPVSFVFATGEHEIVALPETSPWAERFGAGPRERRDDVVDTEPGGIHDTLSEGRSTPAWGLMPRPGRAEVYVYPDAHDGLVIADIVRIDKGHTEGLEPRITETIVDLMVSAPGQAASRLA